MTISTGLVVANLYYNQPLLEDMARTYHVSRGQVGQVSMLTQLGYATGMLLIAPLADMLKRKRLMLLVQAVSIVSLLVAAWSPTIFILLLASFLLGISSMIPQLLVPMAAHLAKPNERGKIIGLVMSGLLIGILLSRTVSGIVGAHFGWRAMFYIAAGLMVIIWLLLFFLLPEVEPEYTGTYGKLMRSLVQLIKEEPKLRLAAVRGALCFACFSAFWTTIVFLLKQNFNLNSDAAGYFGLAGAFGAVAAGLMGRLSDKMNAFNLSTITLLLILVSFAVFMFSNHELWGLVLGVIILDMGVQATHIANQSMIFTLSAQARNRINTVYMVSYFVGGALGTFAASAIWVSYQWVGVCWLGVVLSVIAIIVHFSNRRTIQKQAQPV